MRTFCKSLLALMFFTIVAGGCQTSQSTFDSPDQAVVALDTALQQKDSNALKRIFGPRTEELKSGDLEQDKADLIIFARRLSEIHKIQHDDADHATILVGEEQWPFAVPLVREKSKW